MTTMFDELANQWFDHQYSVNWWYFVSTDVSTLTEILSKHTTNFSNEQTFGLQIGNKIQWYRIDDERRKKENDGQE